MPWVFFFQHRLKLDPALSQVVFIRAVVSGFQLMTIIYQYIILYGCIVWIIIYTYIPLFPACRFFFCKWKTNLINLHKWQKVKFQGFKHTLQSPAISNHSRFGTKQSKEGGSWDWVTACANFLTIHCSFLINIRANFCPM